jgi:predicted Zn-dependent peptidase
VVGLFITGGKAAVPAGLDGLAAISTRLLVEIPDEGKVRDLMGQATRLSYGCLEDFSIVLVECLTEHLEEALRVAAKIVQDPLLSGLRIGRAKDLMTANWKAEDDDAVAAARKAVFRAFFNGRGYGSALFGSEASLKSIDRKDVLAFVRRSVVRDNVFFCVETDLDRDSIRRLLEDAFDSLPGRPAPEVTLQEPALPESRLIRLEKDAKQTCVGRAFALPRSGWPDTAKGVLLETLLGKGPGSRLWALRVDERLAYGVDAEVTWTKSAGLLFCYLETGRDKADEAGAALDRALEDLRESGLSEDDIRATRTMSFAGFLRATEAKAPRLRTIGLFEILGAGPGHGPGPVSSYLAALAAVTRDELNAYLGTILAPDRALRVTVGPAGQERSQGGSPCPD